jgi:hypothetical protein
MSLDVARKAAATLQAIGDVVGLTREWVRQISIDQCEGIISESHTLRPPSHDHDRLEKALEEGLRETFPASDAVACSSARTTRTAQGLYLTVHSSTSRSCHSPESPSSRIGALSDRSPRRRRFMSTTSCSVTPSRRAMILTWSGRSCVRFGNPANGSGHLRASALRC